MELVLLNLRVQKQYFIHNVVSIFMSEQLFSYIAAQKEAGIYEKEASTPGLAKVNVHLALSQAPRANFVT